MRNKEYFRGKKITIVGLARSGAACANLLSGLGAEVSITDNQDNQAIRQNAAKLKSSSVKIEIGKHSPELLKERDLIIISPGVPGDALPLKWARDSGIPAISEIEVGWILCPGTIIAVTGSNGKTTVTTLIGWILAAAGKQAFICGNIGNPFCGEVEKIKEGDFVCLEVSSFQLETIRDFKPRVALILNFSRNHLDRYKDMSEYLQAKKRIFMNQDSGDSLVLNSDDPLLRELAKEAKAKSVFFKPTSGLNPNQAAVTAVGALFGIGKETCLKVFTEFKGVEHRMELADEINGVKFINDSKATTVESAIWALSNTSGSVVLIAGGKDKGLDYSQILPAARQKVKQVILIGQAKEKIRDAIGAVIPILDASGLDQAVRLAWGSAKAGESVLFSPMCSSFDMFTDYEERGRKFKEAVYRLKEGVKQ